MRPTYPVRCRLFRRANQLPHLQPIDRRPASAASRRRAARNAAVPVNPRAAKRACTCGIPAIRRARRPAAGSGKITHTAKYFNHRVGCRCSCGTWLWRLVFLYQAQGESGRGNCGQGKSVGASRGAQRGLGDAGAGHFEQGAFGLHKFDQRAGGRHFHDVFERVEHHHG